MKGNYDPVAFYYDNLTKFVFGNAIKESQQFLINVIKEKSKILIIGGGSGWILEAISARYSRGLEITYIEYSKKMIALSKIKNRGENKVEFINQSIFDVELNNQYDVVITPFIFDNFSASSIDAIINKINKQVVKDGLWLHADFQNTAQNAWWQRLLLRCMYLFFKLTCNIEAFKLSETRSKFERAGYKIISSKTFYSNFICSIVYGKVL